MNVSWASEKSANLLALSSKTSLTKLLDWNDQFGEILSDVMVDSDRTQRYFEKCRVTSSRRNEQGVVT